MADLLGYLRTACIRQRIVVLPMFCALLLSCATDVVPDERLFVTILPEFVHLVGAGDTCQLSATIRNAAGQDITGKATLWQSSNPGVALS